MPRTIWKYDVLPGDFGLDMPKGAKILGVGLQGGKPHRIYTGRVTIMDEGASAWGAEGPRLWALVDPEAPKVCRRFIAVGTGDLFPEEIDGFSHIGTFVLMGGRLVFHVFDAGELSP